MSGIVLPSDNKIPISNLPQACYCGKCNEVIWKAPYYWKTVNGKRRYYFVAHAVRLAIINTNEIAILIKRNKDKTQMMRDKRTHTIATKFRGVRDSPIGAYY